MGIAALALVILSAMFHASWNFLLKKSQDKQCFVCLLPLVGVVLFSPVFICMMVCNPALIPLAGWFCILSTGLLKALYLLSLARAYEDGDLSLAYPLSRSAPVFVPFLAIPLLGEKLTLLGALGILIVLAGIYILHLRNVTLKEAMEPFRSLRGKSARWAILTALLVAIYSVIDKVGVNYVAPFTFLYLMFLVCAIVLCPFVLIRTKLNKVVWNWTINKKQLMAAGFLNLFAYFLILLAMRLSQVSYIVAVRQLSIVFGVILGSLFLEEGHSRIRFAGATTIFFGVFLIGTAG